MKNLYILIKLCMASANSGSQELSSKKQISICADLMSRYVWRGCGIGFTQDITDTFNLPVRCSVITNPKAEHIHRVLGFNP